jgi:hypothetical protein
MGWSMGESLVSFSGLSGKVGGGVLEPHYAIVAACTEYVGRNETQGSHVLMASDNLHSPRAARGHHQRVGVSIDPAVHGVWSGSQVQA